jgi:hypothetical protein
MNKQVTNTESSSRSMVRNVKQKRLLVTIAWIASTAAIGVGLGVGLAGGAGSPASNSGFSPAFVSKLPASQQTSIDNSLKSAGIDPSTNLPYASDATKPKPPAPTLAPIPPITSLPTGVSDVPQSPFDNAQFDATSVWEGDTAGQWWWAYAGSAADGANAGEGDLMLVSAPDTSLVNASTSTQGPFLIGTVADGALTITAESGSNLTVETASGLSCQFDLGSLTFTGPAGC